MLEDFPPFSRTDEALHMIKTEIQTAGHVPFSLTHLECESVRKDNKLFARSIPLLCARQCGWNNKRNAVVSVSVKDPGYQGHPVFLLC